MRIYGDVLTVEDLDYAVRAASEHSTTGRVGFERFETLHGTRVRARGWNVLLYRLGSRRRFNTGNYGSAEEGAASRDDYGWFIAALYARDPGARVAHYTSRENFHASTNKRYAKVLQTS